MADHTRGTALDEASKAMLFEGLNKTELCTAFAIDHKALTERIHGIPPVGQRRGVDIWKIKDVFSALWRPTEDEVDKAMMRLNHAHLPKTLSKEYWAGKRSKQEYMLRNADLWPTVKVVEEVGAMLQIVKMGLLLMADQVERNTELTDRQRQSIKQQTDSTLRDLHRQITERFQPKAGDVRVDEDETL